MIRAEKLFHSELAKNHKRNTVWCTLDGSLFKVYYICTTPAVIIVAFLQHYTDSQILLNLPTFIYNFAFCLLPFIMSFFSGRLKRKKKITILLGIGQRGMWILATLTVYLFSDNRELILPLFLTFFILRELFHGSLNLFWQEMMGRTLLPEKRSSAMGIRESVGNVVGFAVSFPAVYILSSRPFPENFLTLFVIAIFASGLNIFCIGMIKEAPYDRVSVENSVAHLRNLVTLPARDRIFKWYLVFSLFFCGYSFIGSLYTTVGIARFSDRLNGDILSGVMNIVSTLAGAVLVFIASRFYKRVGKYGILAIITACMVLIPLWAMVCRNLYGYMLVFLYNGIIVVMWFVEFNVLLDFAPPEKRHEYIALTAISKLLPIIIYTSLGGYLADRFLPSVTFVTSAIFCFAALMILILKLRPVWKNETVETYTIS